MLLIMYQIFSSSSFFGALFPSLLWSNFFWNTQYFHCQRSKFPWFDIWLPTHMGATNAEDASQSLQKAESPPVHRRFILQSKTKHSLDLYSIFEYASICILTAADCHLRKLQLVQNQLLRLALSSPSYVSIHDLHYCSGFPMLKNHLTDFAQKRLKTMKRTSPLMQPTIESYQEVKHIKENASILDIINLRWDLRKTTTSWYEMFNSRSYDLP